MLLLPRLNSPFIHQKSRELINPAVSSGELLLYFGFNMDVFSWLSRVSIASRDANPATKAALVLPPSRTSEKPGYVNAKASQAQVSSRYSTARVEGRMERLCSATDSQTKPADAIKDALRDTVSNHSLCPSDRFSAKSTSNIAGRVKATSCCFATFSQRWRVNKKYAARGDAYGFNDSEPIRLYFDRLMTQSPQPI